MAWGCFTTIPCPYKKWDENARTEMLLMLPFIGGIIGVIWFWIYKLLLAYGVGMGLSAAVFIAVPGLLYGFIHTDGYMDCCDAIFSRRTLSERQRILKDSTVGAFAVIFLVLIVLLSYGAAFDVFRAIYSGNAASMEIDCDTTFCGYCLKSCITNSRLTVVIVAIMVSIPIISRCCSAIMIWKIKPIGHSQYNQDNNHSEGHKDVLSKTEKKKKQVYTIFVCIILIIAAVSPVLLGIQREDLCAGAYGAAVLLAEIIAYLIACIGAVKNLGGISGDISGFSITIAEAVAVIAMSLVT